MKEFFEYIHKNNFRTAVISSSSYDVVLRAKNELGIDYIFSNALVIKDDKISGDFLWPIGAGNESKAIVMKKLCSDINIETKDVVFIGDSITDLHAVWEAGYSIAFNSKSDELKKNTSVVVDSNDARDLISVLENIKN